MLAQLTFPLIYMFLEAKMEPIILTLYLTCFSVMNPFFSVSNILNILLATSNLSYTTWLYVFYTGGELGIDET